MFAKNAGTNVGSSSISRPADGPNFLRDERKQTNDQRQGAKNVQKDFTLVTLVSLFLWCEHPPAAVFMADNQLGRRKCHYPVAVCFSVDLHKEGASIAAEAPPSVTFYIALVAVAKFAGVFKLQCGKIEMLYMLLA